MREILIFLGIIAMEFLIAYVFILLKLRKDKKNKNNKNK